MRALRVAVRVVLAVFFGVAGVMHLVDPAFFYPQVPTFIPAPDLVIRVTGVLFLLGGLGLLGPARVRRPAGLGLIALLLAVWPGNLWGALQPGSYVSAGGPEILDWVRIPFQLAFMALVYWAIRDLLAAPLRVQVSGAVPADDVVRALTDFGPDRPRRFTMLDPARYTVHHLGTTSAEVTEGARPPGPVERERYDWSTPGTVRIETLESTDFRPGGWWNYRVESVGGQAHVELTVQRPPATVKGRIVTALGWYLGPTLLRRDLRRTLAQLESEASGRRATAGPPTSSSSDDSESTRR